MKTTNTKSYDDIRKQMEAGMKELMAGKRPWNECLEHLFDNVIKVNRQEKCCWEWEDITGRLTELATYYNFLGHDQFKDIIKRNYSGLSKNIGDVVLYRHKDGRMHVGFINAVKTTVEGSKLLNIREKDYIYVFITYIAADCGYYIENLVFKAPAARMNTMLLDKGLTFGRPYGKCIADMMHQREKIETDYKRRAKRKVITVGEYEDLMSIIREMAEDIRSINHKMPSGHHIGPM